MYPTVVIPRDDHFVLVRQRLYLGVEVLERVEAARRAEGEVARVHLS